MYKSSITVAIEGPGADQALAELLAIPGIQGSAAPEQDDQTKGALIVTGTIVGIGAGVATIADKIAAWWDKRKKEAATRRLTVAIQDARGGRLLLENATPEQIAAVLQTLAQ